jgi:16S rRNA (guanine527-N7)-methyltransferase
MEAAQSLSEAAQVLGVALSADAAAKMIRHLELLAEANARFNLTTIPREEWLWAHVLDSLSCAPELQEAIAGDFADLGSGGGFPGVPLAIASGREVVLVESVKKKASFLADVLVDIGVAGRVAPVRAEELALREAGEFAAVTARAVSALPSLVELAAPLLKPGGRLICLKGDPRAEELESGAQAAEICGLAYVGARSVDVPLLDARRTIVIYERVGRPRVMLPRRPGAAQKQPLA